MATFHFAPRPSTWYVLGASARLGLSLPSQCELEPYRPSPVVVERSDYAPPVKLKAPAGWRRSCAIKTDLVFNPDDSGSMYGPGGDPRGVRRAVALSVVRLLTSAGSGSRVGVVHWGSNAPRELALPLTDVRHSKWIKAALAIPPSLGGNNFPAALARTREVLERSGPGRVPLVVAITDGIEEVGASTEAELALLPPGCVHVLLVDHSHGCGPDLDVLDTHRMAWQAAEAVAQAVGLHMSPIAPSTKHSANTRR